MQGALPMWVLCVGLGAQACATSGPPQLTPPSAERPVEEAPPIQQPAAQPVLGTFDEELEQARNAVSELATTPWPQAREGSAHALASLADVLETADCGKVQAARISEIRTQATRLSTADALAFGEGERLRAGLSTVLDALEAIPLGARPVAVAWLRAARRSVATITESTSLSFQRAPVQDAFRTTLDAFVAAAQSKPAC